MRNIHLELRSLAGVVVIWTATSAIAGPVIYAAGERGTSKGTELYVIDPIAATITLVRGVGIGAGGAGTYGGAYAGGGGYGSTSSGAGGTAGGTSAGDFSHFAPGSLSGSLARGPAPLAAHPSDDPIIAAELVTPNTETIDTAPLHTSMPAWLGAQPSSFSGSGRKSAATSSPQFSPSIGCAVDCDEIAEHTSGRSLLSPGLGIGCTGDCGELANTASLGSLLSLGSGTGCTDCKDLADDTLFAPSLLSSCIANCGEGVSSLTQGALQISAVPEPPVLGLLGLGFASIGVTRRRKTLTR